jgi:asparagine synthase (glutamine-hydrolysing)
MCGIVGGISFTESFFPERNELNKASNYLRFRGPDDQGEVFLELESSKVSFAHRRLSIIDLTTGGHQPMLSHSGNTLIVFNGEIYNYLTLKSELIKCGFSFRTGSDTEVILNAFECWGMEKTLKMLDGMFAFALVDITAEKLYLARDRFGKKPLYYCDVGQKLMFSSDIRSFENIIGIDLNINLHSLGYFFSELATPCEDSIYNEIKKVKPAHYLIYNSSGISEYRPYWEVSYSQECNLDQNEIIEKADYLINNAVKKRLIADVKVSALLSGGIDSSLVVAKMALNSSYKVKTYSVGFEETEFNELSYARVVASKFQTDHTELLIDAKAFTNLNQLIIEYGEPFADASMIPTYLMSREISKTEKVVLGGDGGDELFGGYYAHYFARKYDFIRAFGFAYPIVNLLSKASKSYRVKLLEMLLYQTRLPDYTLLNRNMSFSSAELKELKSDQRFFNALDREHEKIWNNYSPGSTSSLINVMATSLKTRLINDYLVKVDRATMYASLEMRSPFLDKDLAEFAATLRPDQLFHKVGTKSILKELAEKSFSKDFVHRRKMGFGIPLRTWFRTVLKDQLRSVILDGKQNKIELNYGMIESLIDQHIGGHNDHTNKLWCLYVFHIWINR